MLRPTRIHDFEYWMPPTCDAQASGMPSAIVYPVTCIVDIANSFPDDPVKYWNFNVVSKHCLVCVHIALQEIAFVTTQFVFG